MLDAYSSQVYTDTVAKPLKQYHKKQCYMLSYSPVNVNCYIYAWTKPVFFVNKLFVWLIIIT